MDVPEALSGADTDVMIDVGAVAGAMQLSLNGMVVTRQTIAGGTWSVKALLKAGKNDIQVRLDTTLLNRVAQTSTGGGALGGGSAAPGDAGAFGVLGPVRLIPVSPAKIE